MADKKIIVTKKANKTDKDTLNQLKQLNKNVTDVKENIEEKNQKETSPRTVNKQQQKRDIIKKLSTQKEQNKNIQKILQIAQQEIISRKLHRDTETETKEDLDLKTIEDVIYELLYEDLHNLLEATTEEISDVVNKKFDSYNEQIFNKNNFGNLSALENLIESIYLELLLQTQYRKDRLENQAKASVSEDRETIINKSRNSMDNVYKNINDTKDIKQTFYDGIQNVINKTDDLKSKESIYSVPKRNKENLRETNIRTEKTSNKESIFNTQMSESDVINNTIIGKAVNWLWKKLDNKKSGMFGEGSVIPQEKSLTEKVFEFLGMGSLFRSGRGLLGKVASFLFKSKAVMTGVGAGTALAASGATGATTAATAAAAGSGAAALAKTTMVSKLAMAGIIPIAKVLAAGIGTFFLGRKIVNAVVDTYKGSRGRETKGIVLSRTLGNTAVGAAGGAITSLGILAAITKFTASGAKAGATFGPKGILVGGIIGAVAGLGLAIRNSVKNWGIDRAREERAVNKYVEEEIALRSANAKRLGIAFNEEVEKRKLADVGKVNYLIEQERYENRSNRSTTADKVIIEKELNITDENTVSKIARYLTLYNQRPKDRLINVTGGYVKNYDPLSTTPVPKELEGMDIDKLAKIFNNYSRLSHSELAKIHEENLSKREFSLTGIQGRATIDNRKADVFENEAIAISGGRSTDFSKVYEISKKNEAYINKEYMNTFSNKEEFHKYIDRLNEAYKKTTENISNKNIETTSLSSPSIVDNSETTRTMEDIDVAQAKRDKENLDVLKEIRDKEKEDLKFGFADAFNRIFESKALHDPSVKIKEPGKGDYRLPTVTQDPGKTPFPILQEARKQEQLQTIRDFSKFNPNDPDVKAAAELRKGPEEVKYIDKYGVKQVASSTVPYYNKDKSRDSDKAVLQRYMAPLLLGKEAVVTSNFGYRPEIKGNKGGGSLYHKGVDFRAKTGDPVHAFGEGKVIFAGLKGGFGHSVAIELADGTVTQSAHLSSVGVKVGDIVKQGDFIGRAGGTGSKGKVQYSPHLDQTFYRDKSMKVSIEPVDYLLKTLNKEYKNITENKTVNTQENKAVNTQENKIVSNTPPSYLLRKEEKSNVVNNENKDLRSVVYNQNQTTTGLRERLETNKTLENNKTELVNNKETNNTVTNKETNNVVNNKETINTIRDKINTVKRESIPGYTQPLKPTNVSDVFRTNNNVRRYEEVITNDNINNNNQNITENKNNSSNVYNNSYTSTPLRIANNINKSETMAKAPVLTPSEQAQIETSREIKRFSETITANNQNINTVNTQTENINNTAMSAVPQSVVEPAQLIPLLIQYMFGIKIDGTNSNQLIPGMV